MPVKSILAGALLFLFAGPVEAAERVCAPAGMLKVVTRAVIPGIAPDHFAHSPKTLYRYLNRYGRAEEASNPETGLQLLIVVDEPHVWAANLATGQGRYMKDSGPTFNFRARIFGDDAVKSPFIRSLELGCELSWLREAGAKEETVDHEKLGKVRKLEFSEGGETIRLFARGNTPVRLELIKNGDLDFAQDYHEYSPNLAFRPELFKMPQGIRFDAR